MSLPLGELIKGLPSVIVHGSLATEIAGLSNHSKQVLPGDLFFAKKGCGQLNGEIFIQEAIENGAVAIALDSFNPSWPNIVQVISPNTIRLEALLADHFYQSPSKDLTTIGITGTNGKTTSAYMIRHMLQCLKEEVGLIGTVEWIIRENKTKAHHTTPDLLTVQKILHQMRQERCSAVAMEVSSHALEQGRVCGVEFSVALYTNLTQDHLDYHKTMVSYAAAKAKLFASLKEGAFAAINIDCPYAVMMQQSLQKNVGLITYGFSDQAQVRVIESEFSAHGSVCTLTYLGKIFKLRTPLIGKFNVYNCLGAISVGLALGFSMEKILAGLETFVSVPGRLEKIANSKGKQIFVDYAHTEDALKNVLETLRSVATGQIVCVFGCGGDRDSSKRPKMGAVVARLADTVFITSDNPRTEDPELIIAGVLEGINNELEVYVEIDRRQAIEKAIKILGPQDILLIAGKGHEDYQIFHDRTIHFDDRIIAKEYCQ